MFERLPSKTPFIATAMAGVFALSACTSNPELGFNESKVRPVILNGFIYNDVNVRTSPQRLDDEAYDNSCGDKIEAAIVLDQVSAVVSDGVGIDNNGPWIGLKPEQLSEFNCQKESMYGGMLWIAQKYVNGVEPNGLYANK